MSHVLYAGAPNDSYRKQLYSTCHTMVPRIRAFLYTRHSVHAFIQSIKRVAVGSPVHCVREARLRFVTSLRAPSLRPLVTRRLRRDDLVASQGQPLERIAYKVRSGVTGSHKGSLSKELHASLTHGRACPLRKTPTMLGNMQGTRS